MADRRTAVRKRVDQRDRIMVHRVRTNFWREKLRLEYYKARTFDYIKNIE